MLAKLLTQVADVKTQLTTLPPPGMSPAGGNEPSESGEGFGESFFTNAYNDLNRGSYDLAKAQFEDFLRYSASSPRAAEAQYYLGQIAYTQGDFGAALSAFDLVLERYPVGFITPEAQYKKALSLIRLGRAADARRELETLVARFPNSSVSENARGMLQEMGGNAGVGDPAAKPSPFRP
jgi:tol-pal system protein YbgF